MAHMVALCGPLEEHLAGTCVKMGLFVLVVFPLKRILFSGSDERSRGNRNREICL